VEGRGRVNGLPYGIPYLLGAGYPTSAFP